MQHPFNTSSSQAIFFFLPNLPETALVLDSSYAGFAVSSYAGFAVSTQSVGSVRTLSKSALKILSFALAVSDGIFQAQCFFLQAELLTGEALFPGSSDIDQLHLQLQLLGPLPATMTRCFASNPHNAQASPLPAKPATKLKVW